MLVSITSSISSSDILCARWASGMPALLTRMVTSPNAASAASTAPAMALASLTSRGTLTADPPDSVISATRSSSFSTRRAQAATDAPAAARVSANRRPSPDDAPVTRATWPVRSALA